MTDDRNAIGAITLFVGDLAHATAWYRRAFEIEPVFEDASSAAFRFGPVIVNLLVRSEAPDLVAPAAVAKAGGGTPLQLTIWVTDVDTAVDAFRARGVTFLNGPQDRSWGVRTAAFADPDGFAWELAQQLAG